MSPRQRQPGWSDVPRELRGLLEDSRARAEGAELGCALAHATQALRDTVRALLERGPAAEAAPPQGEGRAH